MLCICTQALFKYTYNINTDKAAIGNKTNKAYFLSNFPVHAGLTLAAFLLQHELVFVLPPVLIKLQIIIDRVDTIR